MTNFIAVCEELVAALDPKVVLTDGYGPITSLVLRTHAILTHSNKSMTEDLPKYGTLAYCASKFVDYPPMAKDIDFPPMTNLSPAAQAVLDAAEQVPIVLNYAQEIPAFCAAALRAAADQVAPEDYDHWDGRDGEYWAGYEFEQNEHNAHVRSQLLAIADELEAQS